MIRIDQISNITLKKGKVAFPTCFQFTLKLRLKRVIRVVEHELERIFWYIEVVKKLDSHYIHIKSNTFNKDSLKYFI